MGNATRHALRVSETDLEESGQRETWIDVAKGAGILLVVLAHVYADTPFARVVFLFHMPMFFVLSGLTFRARPFPEAARRAAISLLVPYGAYMALIALAFPLDWRSMVVGGQALSGAFGVFWFPTALFAALMGLCLLHSGLGNRWALSFACLSLAAAAHFLPARTPLALGIAPLAIGFLWFGMAVGRDRLGRGRCLWVAAFVVAAWALATALTDLAVPLVDLKYASFGPLLLGPALSAALVVLVIAACRAMATSSHLASVLSFLGRASMTVMFLHQPVHFSLSAMGAPRLAIVAAAIALPLAFHWAASRWMPTRLLFLGRARSRPGHHFRAAGRNLTLIPGGAAGCRRDP